MVRSSREAEIAKNALDALRKKATDKAIKEPKKAALILSRWIAGEDGSRKSQKKK